MEEKCPQHITFKQQEVQLWLLLCCAAQNKKKKCMASANVATSKGVGYRGVETLEASYLRTLALDKEDSLSPVPLALAHKLSRREKKSKKFELLKKRNF